MAKKYVCSTNSLLFIFFPFCLYHVTLYMFVCLIFLLWANQQEECLQVIRNYVVLATYDSMWLGINLFEYWSYPQFQNFNKIVVLSNFIVHTFSYLQIGKNKISSIIIWDLCLWCEKRIKLVLLCHYKFDYLISGVMMASRRT